MNEKVLGKCPLQAVALSVSIDDPHSPNCKSTCEWFDGVGFRNDRIACGIIGLATELRSLRGTIEAMAENWIQDKLDNFP